MDVIQTYSVVVLGAQNLGSWTLEALTGLAVRQFECQGAEEFAIDELEVDRLLGDRSYSGGDLPIETLQEVDQRAIRHSGVSFYFSGPRHGEDAEGFCSWLRNSGIEFSCFEKPTEDWNAKWREHYHPIIVGPQLTIVPSWEKEKFSELDSVFIYPGQGFGTGGHQTTFLCLESLLLHQHQISKIESPCILDFGCGSGILGIASGLILGRRTMIDLLDIDPEALKNSKQNINENLHIQNVFRLLLLSARNKLQKHYHLIFANILAPILIDEKDFLESLLFSRGYIVLSGILKNQMRDIIHTYERSGQLSLVHQKTKDDWGVLVFQRLDVER